MTFQDKSSDRVRTTRSSRRSASASGSPVPQCAACSVDAALPPGRCLGLVGRNGAGKSTLVSILCGLRAPDSGQVWRFDGEPAPPIADIGTWRQRISTVFQHSMTVAQLTVAENIFLGEQPGRRGFVNWRDMRAQTRRVLHEWDFNVDPGRRVWHAHGRAASDRRDRRRTWQVRGTRILLLDEADCGAFPERDGVRRLLRARARAVVASGVAVPIISLTISRRSSRSVRTSSCCVTARSC